MLACAVGKSLVLVLTQENLKRMAEGDPVTHMVKPLMPGAPDIEIVIGSIEDSFHAADAQELLQHVFRGYKKTAEDGHEPIPVMKGNTQA
jgi:hypothetical protein